MSKVETVTWDHSAVESSILWFVPATSALVTKVPSGMPVWPHTVMPTSMRRLGLALRMRLEVVNMSFSMKVSVVVVPDWKSAVMPVESVTWLPSSVTTVVPSAMPVLNVS